MMTLPLGVTVHVLISPVRVVGAIVRGLGQLV